MKNIVSILVHSDRFSEDYFHDVERNVANTVIIFWSGEGRLKAERSPLADVAIKIKGIIILTQQERASFRVSQGDLNGC